jgi:preprotein translocase subunit YajC
MFHEPEIRQTMQHHRLAKLAFAAALAASPLALSQAFAATPAEVHPGMQVVDPSGGAVGIVTGVKGDMLILKTNAHEVQLPLTSFTANQGKLLFGMTAAQLDAATEQAMAAAKAAVAPGASVYGSDGTLAGTIESIDESLVKIKLANGQSIRLPRSGVSGSDKGAVLGVTTAKLNELASQAGAPDASAPAQADATASQPQGATAEPQAPSGK